MRHICQHKDVEEVFGKYDRSVRHEARLVQIVISLTHIMNEEFRPGIAILPDVVQAAG
jgi:hypothetical protein